MKFIPKPSIMDTVVIGGDPTRAVPTKNFFLSLFCKHSEVMPYTRIDHSVGPGSFADNYDGKVCMLCAKILEEERKKPSSPTPRQSET